MKNRKKEIIIAILAVIFLMASIYCYVESKTIVSTAEVGYEEKGTK